VAENGVECRVGKGQLLGVGYRESEVSPTDRERITARRGRAVLLEIDGDDPAGVHRLSQTQRDRCLTAAAIEDHHAGPQVRQKKARVDLGTPGLDRPLNRPRFLRALHRCYGVVRTERATAAGVRRV